MHRHRASLAVAAAAAAVVASPLLHPDYAAAQTFIGQNFTASSRPTDSTFIPPDTCGAAGVDHFVELINGRYSVYRKSDGARVQTAPLNTFWAAAGAPHTGSFAFDPRILYDPYVKRWYALSVDNASGPNNFLFAISNSADPTAGWKGFQIDANTANTHWADFPMMGYNADAIVVTANMFGIGGGSTNKTFVVIPKNDLLGAVPSVANLTKFEGISVGTGFSVQPAVDMDNGSLPLPLLSSSSSTTLKRSSIGGSALSPSLITAGGTISVSTNSSPPTADQPGPKQNIDAGGDTRFRQNTVLNNGELWSVHTVNSGGRAALRWYRINATTNAVIQSGVINDPSLAFIYGSIAVNDFGDVVIGMSGTDPSTFVSTYAVVGKTAGNSTTFGTPFQTKAGVSDYQRLDGSNRNRWGDYSATTNDPADPAIFWTIQEFVSATDQWSTQVTEILVPQPGEVRWASPLNGNFGSGSAWFGGAAPGIGDHVIFSRATNPASPSGYVVTLPGNVTSDRLSVRQGRMQLNLAGNFYTTASTSSNDASFIVGEFGGAPSVIIANGTLVTHHTIIARRAQSEGRITLDNATWINSGNLWLGGDAVSSGGAARVDVGPGSSLSIAGTTHVRPGGLLTSSAAVVRVGSLDMQGGQVTVAPGGGKVLRADGLLMSAGAGTIQLHDNAMVIDYIFASPIDTVRARITEARNGGAWNGPGITSAAADAASFGIGYAEASSLFGTFPAVFMGQAVDGTTVLLRHTRYGDANLDGVVNLADFNRLAANFGSSSAFWHLGDFNYDSIVNLSDFNLLAANFGLTACPDGPTPEDWAALASAVPEPAGALAGALLGATLLSRRSRALRRGG